MAIRPFSQKHRALWLAAALFYGILLIRFGGAGDPIRGDRKPAEQLEKPIRVRVTGEVPYPGTYDFPRPSTVWEAICSAGGVTDEADPGLLNLNEQLVPESVLQVPSRLCGFVPILSLNHSPAEELVAISGIGPKLAGAIVSNREREGLFRKMEDLLRVPGIGPQKLRRIEKQAVLDRRCP